ncbi:ArsR/SmtB family transcription factor [Streptomyces sp. 8L]|uniref:ArsR/SmtB family transcription factor n=1 Tax=Streptomyces sp. 8L TaxID=2877242 RepID=UPI001CD773DE|nr:winged helix-turn-helix domain-containing protein [Streptomyces sp. 8L]MCA1218641.1 winged helix-turn-helix domain-containing protein [Streptomyces sp. 8L]
MGLWLVDTDTLAGSRFVLSPLAETVACLQTLQAATAAHPGERRWLDTHLPAYRELLAGDPVTAALGRIALGGSWNAGFLTPVPDPGPDGPRTFHDELAPVRATSEPRAHADLARCHGGPLPPRLRVPDPAPRLAGLLEWVWTHTVEPYWPVRRRALEADVVARVGRLGTGGWCAVLDDLRPGTRWLGEGRLQINTRDYPPRTATGALLFVPVTPRRGWVSWAADRFALIHPCTGPLAQPPRPTAPGALGRLLGPSRAAVLVLLDGPKSTTQLVALTGQGLGSVGRHLRVLLDAPLVRRSRAGRSVLYHRTAAGDGLVDAQSGD